MLQKGIRAVTSVRASARFSRGPGVPDGVAPRRRSPRLISLPPEDHSVSIDSPSRVVSLSGAGEAGPTDSTPCERSSHLRYTVECPSGAGPAGEVASTQRRRSLRILSTGRRADDIADRTGFKEGGGRSARSQVEGPKLPDPRLSGARSTGGVAANPCRRSPRLLSLGDRGGDITGSSDSKKEGGRSTRNRQQAPEISSPRPSSRRKEAASTQTRSSSRILSLGRSADDIAGRTGSKEGGGRSARSQVEGPKLLDPRLSGARSVSGVAANPCRRSPRLLSLGDHGGDITGSSDSKKEGGRSTSNRQQAPEISSPGRSSRNVKTPANSGGVSHACATGGGSEGKCLRRSARLRVSTGTDLTGEIEHGSGSDETEMNLNRNRKETKTYITDDLSKGPEKLEAKSTAVGECGGDGSINKGKKRREMTAVPVMQGGRDKKQKQTMEIQRLGLESREFEGSSGCSEWTNEQEMSLHRAYILAKPSPHFWKNVAKLVPGKSAQECFDRMHSKIMTPAPTQPRSRTKAIDFSPQGFNDLLNKDTRRSKNSKRKTLLSHKLVRHILRKHSAMDQGQEVDLFSVLETSPKLHANLSQIKMPLSPGCVTATPQLLQSSSDNHSSANKKIYSRFKSQSPANYVSPEVLKPVKNIVLHEKYIDELHCREVRRKRVCDKTSYSIGDKDDKENVIAKDVKSAKNALISEAKGIICRLEPTESSPSGNSEDIYGCEDECEEDM